MMMMMMKNRSPMRQNREKVAKIQYLRKYTSDINKLHTMLIVMLIHRIDESQHF